MKNYFATRIIESTRKNLLFWIIGFFAFVWIVIRSGTNPKRLVYPCQKAAFPFASAWIIAIVGLVSGSFFLNKRNIGFRCYF